jgi:hypothetical protein
MTETVVSDPTVDDAIAIIIDLIRNRQTEIGQYGYDVYLPLVGFPDCASFKIIELLLSHLLFPAFD